MHWTIRPTDSPAPLAWTTLSGIRSLSKCASSSRKVISCSSKGPRGPTVKLAPRLSTGAPWPVTICVFSVCNTETIWYRHQIRQFDT
jgi:hypothetical protein